MQLRRFFKGTMLTVFTLLVAAVILLFTLDFGFLRGTVEDRVSQATGRDFTIQEGLSIRLGRVLVVQAKDLRLSNAEWEEAGEFIKIGQLDAVIDPWTFWDGPLDIKRIKIDVLDVTLVQNEAGQSNWEITAPGPVEEEIFAELPFLIGTLDITAANIEFLSPRLDQPLLAGIERMENSLESDGMIHTHLVGQLNGQPVRINGTVGPYERLLSGDDINVEGTGNFGSIELALNASFGNLWNPQRPTIDLHLAGPEFEQLTGMLGIQGLGGGDLELHATTKAADNVLSARLAGNLGQFIIDIHSDMPAIPEIARAAFQAQISGPNFGRVARLAGFEGWPEEPFELITALQRPDNALHIERFELSLAGAEIDLSGVVPTFPEVTGLELELQIIGPDLAPFEDVFGLKTVPVGAFSLTGSVSAENDTTGIDILFEIPLGSGRVSGVLGSGDGLVGTDLAITGEGPDVSALGNMLDIPGLAAEPWTYQMAYVVEDPEFLSVRDTRFSTAGFTLEWQGQLGTKSLDQHTDVRFSASGNRLADFQAMAGDRWLLPDRPFVIEGRVRAAPAAWQLIDVSGNAGSTTFTLNGPLGTGAALAGTVLKFSVSGDRLVDFQNLVGDAFTLPEQPFSIGGQVTAAGGGWDLAAVAGNAGTTQFELNGHLGTGEMLDGTKLSLDLSGTDFGKMLDLPGHARAPDGPFTASARIGMQEGRLSFAQTNFNAGAFNLKLDADVPWPLDMSNGRFSLDTSGSNITRVLPELAGIDFDSEDFEMRATGRWQDGEISIQQGFVRIGESSLSVQGTLDLPPNLSATDLIFDIESPDLSRLGTLDGVRWGTVPFTLRTSFAGTSTKLRLERFQAQLGKSNFKGAFSIDFEPEVPLFDLRLSTDALDLKPFLSNLVEEEVPEETQPQKDARLIPDLAFPMDTLAGIDGHFAITADRVILQRSTLVSSALIGDVRNGSLNINEVGIDGYGGRLTASLSLVPKDGGGASLKIAMQSKGLKLDFTGQPEEDREALPAFDIDINLEGSGSTTREAAAVLNGEIAIDSKGGQIKTLERHGLDSLFLAQIVSAISPDAAKREVVNISCFAVAINARDGVLFLDPGMAIQSNKLNLFASGEIDLGTEKLDVNFRAKTRKTVDLSAGELVSPYLKLSGTLAEPSIALDPKGTLLSASAAYLSGGLSILAKKALDQLAGTEDPCADYLREVDNEDP